MKKPDIYKGVEQQGNIGLSPLKGDLSRKRVNVSLDVSPYKECRWPYSKEQIEPWGPYRRWPKSLPETQFDATLAADRRAAKAVQRTRLNSDRAVRIHRRQSKQRENLSNNRLLARSFELRGEMIERKKAEKPRAAKKKPRKTHAEIAAETDVQVRATLFLNEEEQKQNNKFLNENNRVRLPETDEDAAEAQQSEFETRTSPLEQLAAAIDQATGVTLMHWNADIVGDRLIEAYRTLDLLPLSTLPASFKSSMPSIIRDETDRKGEQDQREKHDRERNRVRLTASSFEILRMEESFLWPIRLLKKEKFRRIVFLWAQWRAQRKNIRVMCRLHNIDYSTLMRRREIAVLAIAYELNNAKVPVVISERVSSRARRRRKLRNSTASTKKKTQARAIIRGEVHDFS